ncbi:N-acetyl-gamma-glutamyl-phosphate reductase [Kitasatospora sp. NPDC094011]|uniref:N-acetyl-gamma-glutamyl-phosphate reductase n=1 Tax=Kitasatospora sp. NPDC094011 TaxID=3364090 RepID=UPI0037FE23A3
MAEQTAPAGAQQERPFTVAVLGGTGYTGAELIRLLAEHPNAELAFLSSERSAGQSVASVLPWLRNHPVAGKLKYRPLDELTEVDVAFGCLPGGQLPGKMGLVAERAKRVLNLAGDFRLRDPEQAAAHYPASAAWPEPFAYHVPEFDDVPENRFVNLPGCMAVSTIYALRPLLAAGLVEDDVVVDAKTGSSGSGRTSNEHPADRAGNFRVHKLFGHRHGPEIAQALADYAGGAAPRLQFSTYSLDTPRGIVITAYSRLRPGVTGLDVRRAYAASYARTPFVRLRQSPKSPQDFPMLKSVVGSNVAEVAVSVRDGRCVIVAALDNLLKGAAGQAVQVFNRLHGLPEATGLPFTAVAP